VNSGKIFHRLINLLFLGLNHIHWWEAQSMWYRPTINRHVALLLPNTSKRHLKKRFSLLTFVSRAQQLVVVIPTILPQKPSNSATCHFLISQLLLCHTPSLSTYSFPRTYHVHLFTTHARQVPILIGFNQPNYAISQVHVLLNSSNTLLSGRHIFLLNLQTFSWTLNLEDKVQVNPAAMIED
jgi:hypothetical protein